MLIPSMRTYRYSEAAIDRMTRRAVRLNTLVMFLAGGAGALAAGIHSTLPMPTLLMVWAVLQMILVFWARRRARIRTSASVRASVIEFDDSRLRYHTPMIDVTICREDVRGVRFIPDGIVIRGLNRSQTILLRRELDDFDDLTARIRDWRPEGVTANSPSRWQTPWFIICVVVNLALFVAGMGSESRVLSIPACVIEAGFLLCCVVLVLRNRLFTSRMKWQALILLLPLPGLAFHTYTLLTRI